MTGTRWLALLAALAGAAYAQNAIYLRSGPAYTVADAVVQPGNSTIQVTLAGEPGWREGQVVRIDNVLGCVAANGTHRVSSVKDGNRFEIQSLGGESLACTGKFSSRVSVPARAGAVEPHELTPHPRVLLDGPEGALTTASKNKAVGGWPIFDGLITRADVYASTPSTYTRELHTGYASATCATAWQATGARKYLDCAKYMLNNVEKSWVTFGMDRLRRHGGRNSSASGAIADYGSYHLGWLGIAYTIVRDQLTAEERASFAAKMLNDEGDNCRNQVVSPADLPGTVSISKGVVTGVGTAFETAGFKAGDVLHFIPNTTFSTNTYAARQYVIASVEGETQMTLVNTAINETPGLYRRAAQWQDGQNYCGLVWATRFAGYAILSDSQRYGYLSGSEYPAKSNLANTNMQGVMFIGLALAGDDPRANRLAEGAAAYAFDSVKPFAERYWAGMTQTGASYYMQRVPGAYAASALALRNSIKSGADPLDVRGEWLKQYMKFIRHATLGPKNLLRVGSTAGSGIADADNMSALWIGAAVFRDEPAGKYLRWWAENRWGGWNSGWSGTAGHAIYAFLMMSPGDPMESPEAHETLQTWFTKTKSGEEYPIANVLSRSGFAAGDTALRWKVGACCWLDHDGEGARGDYSIARGQYLLGGDSSVSYATCTSNLANACFETGSGSPWRHNILWAGARGAAPTANGYLRALDGVSYPPMTRSRVRRWAGEVETGDRLNRYVYGMYDGMDNYVVPELPPSAGTTRTWAESKAAFQYYQRHLAHFKGAAEYVLVYDDFKVRTLNVQAVSAAVLHHYGNNGQSGEGDTTMSGDTVTSNYLAVSSLVTKVVLPEARRAVLESGTSSTSVPTSGTKRLVVCPSEDGGQTCADTAGTTFLIIHRPGDGGRNLMPPTVTLRPDGWEGVEIQDERAPAVALFHKGTLTADRVSFVTTHASSGRYLLAGLTPGRYAIKRGGEAVGAVGTEFEVAVSDNTLYWEGAAGEYTVERSGATRVAITTQDLADGTIGMQYEERLRADGGAPPYRWAVVDGAAPSGLSLSEDGRLSGVPTAAGTFNFTVEVSDSSDPVLRDQRSFAAAVAPVQGSSLSVTVEPGSTQALVRYGRDGLDANQSCTLTLSLADEESQTAVETYVDAGGPAVREWVFGGTVPLQPETPYLLTAACGRDSAVADFLTTAPNPDGETPVRVVSGAVPASAATMRVEYGASKALGQSAETVCATECIVDVQARPGRVLYTRRTFFDASGTAVASSGVSATLLR